MNKPRGSGTQNGCPENDHFFLLKTFWKKLPVSPCQNEKMKNIWAIWNVSYFTDDFNAQCYKDTEPSGPQMPRMWLPKAQRSSFEAPWSLWEQTLAKHTHHLR